MLQGSKADSASQTAEQNQDFFAFAPAVTLSKETATIKCMEEKFGVNPVTDTGSFWDLKIMGKVWALAIFLCLVLLTSPAEAQVISQSRADLVVSFDGVPSVLSPGQPLGAGSRIVARNIGSSNAPGSRAGQTGYMIDVVLSTDTNVPEGFAIFNENFREDVLLRGGRVSNTPDLAGGASVALDIENDTIPTDVPDGNYQLCARIDPANVVAELRKNNNVTCQPVRITRATEEKITLFSVKSRSPIKLTLDEHFYSTNDRLRATLELGVAFVRGDIEGVLLVSEEAGDIERLVMRRSGGAVFQDTDESIVRVAQGTTGTQLDGTLTARPGDHIVALFYPDSARHNEREAGLVVDYAIFESALSQRGANGEPLLAQIRVESKLLELDKGLADAAERPFGSFLTQGTLPVQVATEQVIFRPQSAADLNTFLTFSGGRIISHQPASAESAGDQPENRMYLIDFDPARARLDRLGDLRRLFGETDDMLVANSAVSRLYAFVLESRLRGFAVAANQKVQFMDAPRTTETRSGALLPTMGRINNDIDVPMAWAFNALWDGDENRVNVGVIDMGFITDHPDFRRPASGAIQECNFDNAFLADVLLRAGNCGTGNARGVPTVGNSFFGERSWHGTGATITAGGILNNNWRPGATSDVGGSAGVAGQVMVPMLYKTGLSSYVYEMGTAMRQAVDQGASCINISAGYPCRIKSSVLPDIDLCAPGGREGLCGALLGVASVAAATICASAGAVAAIPLVGPLIAAPLLLACGAATTTVGAVLPACISFFIASGDVRSAMRVGAEYAERNGVPVVSIAGNQISSIPSEIRPFIDSANINTGDWGIIPAILPTVIGVGSVSSNNALRNQDFAGSAVTIWAPECSRYHAPDVNSIPTGVISFEQKSICATSSAAPFVTGVIANMQAVDSTLNPRTPGLSDALKQRIPTRIRTILTATAAASPDPIVRGVVSPNNALREAARLAGVPSSLSGYDTALNFDETTPTAAKDTASNAQAISFRSTVTGTILTIRGEPPTTNNRDQDWFQITLPSTPRSGTFTVRARLRMPTASRWGRLELGSGFTVESTREVNPNETEITFVRTLLNPNSNFAFPVRGVVDQDNVYRLTVDTPIHIPLEADIFEGTTPRFDAWRLLSETLVSKAWQLYNNEPSLHTVSDVDSFIIAGLPPTQVYSRLVPSGVCQPRLQISHPNGVNIAYSDNRGVSSVNLDSRRRERATLAAPGGNNGYPVSVIPYSSRESLPTQITLTYSVAPGGIPVDYIVLLNWITVENDLGGICSRPSIMR